MQQWPGTGGANYSNFNCRKTYFKKENGEFKEEEVDLTRMAHAKIGSIFLYPLTKTFVPFNGAAPTKFYMLRMDRPYTDSNGTNRHYSMDVPWGKIDAIIDNLKYLKLAYPMPKY